jgi:FixJ family two-component response regulator
MGEGQLLFTPLRANSFCGGRLLMNSKAVLIVDDEKSIRLTLSSALEAINISTNTAITVEEAFQKLADASFQLILLDFKLPGMDGLEVLRRVTEKYPNQMVIIITAYGSIELAVEAMRLGAVDFLQKPFDLNDVRDLVSRVLQVPPKGRPARKYEYYVSLAKQSVNAGEFEVARVYAKKAIFIKYNRPEAYNILGGICEVKGDRAEANTNYRTALEMDPTDYWHFDPARISQILPGYITENSLVKSHGPVGMSAKIILSAATSPPAQRQVLVPGVEAILVAKKPRSGLGQGWK